jgi:threonylcarbamoyladenosine tRNA methylthiotransferase MtaB
VVPDLVLVNTCTVTKRADQQTRQTVRRLAREHPGLPIWITGCYAQRAPAEVATLPGVTGVLGNQEKMHLVELLKNYQSHMLIDAAALAPCPRETERLRLFVEGYSASAPFITWRIHGTTAHTRARLKIQEGCSHQCSYCIVPQVRGPRRSLDQESVLASLQELANLGYREVVLTGVDLGQYGLDHCPAIWQPW